MYMPLKSKSYTYSIYAKYVVNMQYIAKYVEYTACRYAEYIRYTVFVQNMQYVCLQYLCRL